MGFQPYNSSEKLLYPSQQQETGEGLYSTSGLNPAGDLLYEFEIGDYAYPSLVPVPHVEMTLFALDSACITITVYRTASRRTMAVRGQINVYAVGGRNVVDWEAPFGIPLTYRAEQFDIDGNSIGFTAPFTTQLNVAQTWVHNPFDPARAVAVTMAGGTAGTLSRPTQTDVYYPSGSGLAVAISGQRQGVTGVDVSFLTFTEDEADRVRGMFGDPYVSPSVPPVLVIRTGAGLNMRLPQPFFASVPDAAEMPLDTASGGHLTRWECTATEIAAPAPALVAAVLTYADLDTSYTTYAAMDAAYDSYLERDRDYSLAGTAGTETP